MDPKPPSRPTNPISSPKHQITALSSIKDEATNSRRSLDVSPPVSDSTHESNCQSLSHIKSPPIQVMERPEDFDLSNRFSSSSSSSEWSSVSDESLFSIHFSNTYKYDQAYLPEHSNQSDVGSLKVGSLKVESLNKLEEPQKVVRWKTQVERLADEGMNSEGQRLESSPLKDHKSSEPKNKFCWSTCDCGSCNLPKWSCWNGCWKKMSCSNCKPKKTCSSHSKEANAPTNASPKKHDSKPEKMNLQKWCCCGSCLLCLRSCSCHFCLGDISV